MSKRYTAEYREGGVFLSCKDEDNTVWGQFLSLDEITYNCYMEKMINRGILDPAERKHKEVSEEKYRSLLL